MQKFEDNSQVIVTRGSKTLAKDTEVTVLGYDTASETYAVKTPDNGIRVLKESALGPKPERSFTQSEIVSALQEAVNYGESDSAIGRVAQSLGLGQEIAYPVAESSFGENG